MRHFLSLSDYSTEELNTLLGLAVELKKEFNWSQYPGALQQSIGDGLSKTKSSNKSLI
jgi:ornithine carbamoyltransferase